MYVVCCMYMYVCMYEYVGIPTCAHECRGKYMYMYVEEPFIVIKFHLGPSVLPSKKTISPLTSEKPEVHTCMYVCMHISDRIVKRDIERFLRSPS